jgi:hypothetical protein
VKSPLTFSWQALALAFGLSARQRRAKTTIKEIDRVYGNAYTLIQVFMEEIHCKSPIALIYYWHDLGAGAV